MGAGRKGAESSNAFVKNTCLKVPQELGECSGAGGEKESHLYRMLI